MKGKVFWLSIAAVIASFVGGFLLANALNRNDISTLKAENDRLKNAQIQTKQNETELNLSDEEIQTKIAEADRNPNNFAYQKNLGLALSRYAAMKQDPKLLNEVGRLLNRAFENNRQDYDVIVALGNIYFDIGFFQKDNAQFQKAREFYQKALEQKSNDADVKTDLGLTYFLTDPPENDKAFVELQKALQINPKQEKALQVIAQILISQNKPEEAEKFVKRLKEVNSANQTIPELETKLSEAKNLSQKR